LSYQDQATITKAYQTTSTYAYNYAKKFNFKQSLKTGVSFEAGMLLTKAENYYDVSLETSQEWTISETWTDSSSTTQTTATAVTRSQSITCSYSPVVPAGHSLIVSGLQTSGDFNIPYKGNYSFQLASGAVFTFPSAGDFAYKLQTTECSFTLQYDILFSYCVHDDHRMLFCYK
jgi:hypothetical protein